MWLPLQWMGCPKGGSSSLASLRVHCRRMTHLPITFDTRLRESLSSPLPPLHRHNASAASERGTKQATKHLVAANRIDSVALWRQTETPSRPNSFEPPLPNYLPTSILWHSRQAKTTTRHTLSLSLSLSDPFPPSLSLSFSFAVSVSTRQCPQCLVYLLPLRTSSQVRKAHFLFFFYLFIFLLSLMASRGP